MSFRSSIARFKTPVKRLALVAGFAIGMQGAAFAGELAAPYYVYGIDGKGKINEIKLQNQATGGPQIQYQKVVLNTGLTGDPASFNALSYDISRDDLFFAYNNTVSGVASPTTYIYWWDKRSQSISSIYSLAADDGTPTSAAYYNNAIWFFENEEEEGTQTAKLAKIALTYDGFGVPTASAPVVFNVPLTDPVGTCNSGLTVGTGPCKSRQVFGDIAIDSTGKLYAATANNSAGTLNVGDPATTSVFYTVNLGTCATGSPNTCSPADNLAVSGLFGYQLSFGYAVSGIDNATLVGTKDLNGELGLVDLATGAFTAYNGSAQLTNPTYDAASLLRDLAGPAPYTVPGPFPLLGAGAALGWSRRLRRRIGKSSKA